MPWSVIYEPPDFTAANNYFHFTWINRFCCGCGGASMCDANFCVVDGFYYNEKIKW